MSNRDFAIFGAFGLLNFAGYAAVRWLPLLWRRRE